MTSMVRHVTIEEKVLRNGHRITNIHASLWVINVDFVVFSIFSPWFFLEKIEPKQKYLTK